MRRAGWALAAVLAASAGTAWAQVGEVEFARGVGFAQTPGQAPRTLGKGLPLKEGDRLTTADGASAIVKLEDGTRMTVRPNSELVISQYQFKENSPDNSMLLQMVRGGFRAVTGLISKASPNAAKVQTSTATIGIRGTDFDARICNRDCAAESQKVAEAARPNAVLASAKVVQATGEMYAVDANNQRRRLVEGGSVYPGDVIETAAGTRAVIAFRDDTRLTLGPSTRFRVDNFVYDEQNAGEGRFFASLLRGSVRALTGLIAKANNRNVGFSTATATIGIRGTGFDMTCGDTCTLYTWLGSIVVTPQGQTALQVLQSGQGLAISPTGGITAISAPPAMDGPRPDTVTVPPKLFSKDSVPEGQDGLYVFVRDGHIEVDTVTGEKLHMGRGEAGFASNSGEVGRPSTIPRFLSGDRTPMPDSRNLNLKTVLDDINFKEKKTCS
ncbi:FecR family protein [Ramlibacter humi]|nr:FecR family protein [Ramlibacter humi]